jgi:hypothetical protein
MVNNTQIKYFIGFIKKIDLISNYGFPVVVRDMNGKQIASMVKNQYTSLHSISLLPVNIPSYTPIEDENKEIIDNFSTMHFILNDPLPSNTSKPISGVISSGTSGFTKFSISSTKINDIIKISAE